MIGRVDEGKRALLSVSLRAKLREPVSVVEAWVDTAFDGHFVFPLALIEKLGLDTLAETEATLADGTIVSLESYVAFLEWFGDLVPVQVIANEGRFPLLGTELLDDHCLQVDYKAKTLTLE